MYVYIYIKIYFYTCIHIDVYLAKCLFVLCIDELFVSMFHLVVAQTKRTIAPHDSLHGSSSATIRGARRAGSLFQTRRITPRNV